MTPYSPIHTNEIIRFIEEDEKNITGLIIITNDMIKSNTSYGKPSLISTSNTQTANNIRKYSVQENY